MSYNECQTDGWREIISQVSVIRLSLDADIPTTQGP
jgi:hypothetical protein